MNSDHKRLTQLGFGGKEVTEAPKVHVAISKGNANSKGPNKPNKLSKDQHQQIQAYHSDGAGNNAPTQGKSSGIPLPIRAESPWKYYTKSSIIALDLGGSVIIAKGRPSSEPVGLRRIPKEKATTDALAKLQKLRHTNIYFALEAFVTDKFTYVVFEQMDLTLSHLVISAAYPSSQQLATVLGQILDALAYLETEGISHGLLNCENILVKKSGLVKLGQQEAYQSTSIARRSKDIHDFGLVTMQMMQKYKPDDGAIGVADPSHWGDYAQLIIQFVSDIPLASSATKLRKHDFIESIWKENRCWELETLWNVIVSAQYTAQRNYHFTPH
ncbi:kinase-like domain-containing protein [Dactylonectria estremocensis]|uniref:Kinase-like domain-containing protein n=1 Tax=Dactylonectria estremocensis TaxID=1079267 RepID=A0A9P9I7Y5_9HYPO|nr:kinase-like domain-containing protein [Dactylonectria estremocensis]